MSRLIGTLMMIIIFAGLPGQLFAQTLEIGAKQKLIALPKAEQIRKCGVYFKKIKTVDVRAIRLSYVENGSTVLKDVRMTDILVKNEATETPLISYDTSSSKFYIWGSKELGESIASCVSN